METTQADIRELRKLRDHEREIRELMLDIARRRREIIIRLHANGMKMERIAAIYAISRQRVFQIINRVSQEV